jgi:hypothetical protein
MQGSRWQHHRSCNEHCTVRECLWNTDAGLKVAAPQVLQRVLHGEGVFMEHRCRAQGGSTTGLATSTARWEGVVRVNRHRVWDGSATGLAGRVGECYMLQCILEHIGSAAVGHAAFHDVSCVQALRGAEREQARRRRIAAKKCLFR